MITKKTAIITGLGLGALLLPESAFAYDGDMFSTQITTIEKLLTGGYMRLGLLGVCAATAIIGAVKQSLGMVGIGLAACLVVFLMNGWLTTHFACVI